MALSNSQTQSLTVIPKGAYTSTQTSATIDNPHASHALVVVRVSAGPGTAAGVDQVQPQLEYYEPAEAVWISCQAANSIPVIDGTQSLAASYVYRMMFSPSAANLSYTTNTAILSIPGFVGNRLRVRMVHTGSAATGSWTYSASLHLSAS